MNFFIGMKDLAANALIEILKKQDVGVKNFVTFSELESYGTEVVRLLSEKNENVVLLLSRDDTSAFFRDYSDFFEMYEDEEGSCIGIKLREDKTLKDLIYKFRGYLALDVLMAFVNQEAVQVLGV